MEINWKQIINVLIALTIFKLLDKMVLDKAFDKIGMGTYSVGDEEL